MANKTVIVKNALDTRQAALFVQTASQFKSNVKVSIENKIVSAKSLMCIISLGITQGSEVTIHAEGEDEAAAAEKVASVLG